MAPAADPATKVSVNAPTVSEQPPGNSTNIYNLIDIDPLTGRATLQEPTVEMKLYDQVTSGQPSPGFGTAGRWQVTGTGRPENLVTRHVSRVTGFTMVEIAICLAIIGIALVAIIGVLPIGINVQRDNREETLIDQDATVLLENIRNGARGLDDLTNYVYAITNYWTEYNAAGKVGGAPVNINGYTSAGAFIGPGYSSSVGLPLTNGVNIIGLLSTPEYTDQFRHPARHIVNGGYISNYVVAYVHSLSGPAVEKPPQDNAIMRRRFLRLQTDLRECSGGGGHEFD